jgi:prepilin-type N-terminal cleavage/methylation domain-containing protein
MRSRFVPPHSDGFTLLELLVALSIGALLLGILGSVLGGVVDTARKVFVTSGEQEDVALASRTLSGLLKAAIPPTPRDSLTQFSGRSNALVFNATPPESMAPFGVLRVRLYLDVEASGVKGLYMDAMSATQRPDVEQIVLKRHRLLSNVSSVTFQYFDSVDGATVIRDSWDDPSKLPRMVRVLVTRLSERFPFSLTVAPRRSVNGQCRFDQIGSTCRF